MEEGLSFTIKQQQQEATLKNFGFKWRNSKCLLVSNRTCLPSQNRPKVCFIPRLALGPLGSGGGGGEGWGAAKVRHAAFKGGGDMGNPGSIHNTWIPKLRRTLAFLGILSRDVD